MVAIARAVVRYLTAWEVRDVKVLVGLVVFMVYDVKAGVSIRSIRKLTASSSCVDSRFSVSRENTREWQPAQSRR